MEFEIIDQENKDEKMVEFIKGVVEDIEKDFSKENSTLVIVVSVNDKTCEIKTSCYNIDKNISHDLSFYIAKAIKRYLEEFITKITWN